MDDGERNRGDYQVGSDVYAGIGQKEPCSKLVWSSNRRPSRVHEYILVLIHTLRGWPEIEFPEGLYWYTGPDITDHALRSECDDNDQGDVDCISRCIVPPEDAVVLEENTRFDEAEGDTVRDDAPEEIL